MSVAALREDLWRLRATVARPRRRRAVDSDAAAGDDGQPAERRFAPSHILPILPWDNPAG